MNSKAVKTLELSDPATLALLLEPKKLRWLEPFAKTPCSLKEAAEQLGSSMGSYSYWLRQFLEHGLLELVFEEKRQGSPVKYYQATAQCFSFKVSQAIVEQSEFAADATFRKMLLKKLEAEHNAKEQHLMTLELSSKHLSGHSKIKSKLKLNLNTKYQLQIGETYA